MSERIPVVVRIRPATEAEQRDRSVVKCSQDRITVNDKTYPLPGYGPDVSSEKIYTDHLMTLVLQGISRGINVGILCMGGSKSGKSHSLASPSTAQQGLVALTADSVFSHVEKVQHFVGVSYLNIFQEKFTDLLNPADQDIKVKSHPNFGQYFEELSEIIVKSKADLMRLFDQGNKVRKILELEQSIPGTKSHTIFKITCEHKTKEQRLVRSQIFFFNVAGLNHSKDHDVSNSLASLQSVVMESGATKRQTGHVGSKLTQILKPLLDRSSYLGVIGHITASSQSLGVTTDTVNLLMKFKEVEVEPKSRIFDPQELIAELRKRVATSRNNIMAQNNSGKLPKEDVAELESSMAALSAVKRLQWPERERASSLAEEQRRQTLADKGVLEWITETTVSHTSSSVLLLQRDKDKMLAEYKTQRRTVDTLKGELQSRITTHTQLSEQPNQSEEVLQESLAGIHTLRDQLKTANERLKELKRDVKDTQDKLRTERSGDPQKEGEVSGNFTLTMMMRRDELNHLKRDNKLFLDEEKERVQSEADQEVAELRLSASQGSPALTLQQITALQEEHAQARAQLSHLALHVQCLQAENEKLSETVDALNSAHQSETESQRARNLLTFRQFKDFHEEQTTATTARYQELVNACVQDSVFLSSKNAELSEENAELKRKLKHFR